MDDALRVGADLAPEPEPGGDLVAARAEDLLWLGLQVDPQVIENVPEPLSLLNHANVKAVAELHSTEKVSRFSRTDASAPGSSPGAGRAAEIDAVMEMLEGLLAEGTVDIGVISPFRDHAEALEARLSERFDSEEIRRLRLRVGTCTRSRAQSATWW